MQSGFLKFPRTVHKLLGGRAAQILREDRRFHHDNPTSLDIVAAPILAFKGEAPETGGGMAYSQARD